MTRYYSVLSNPYFQQKKFLIGPYFVEYKNMHNSRSFRPYFDLILSLMCPYTVLGALIDPYISLIKGGVDKYVALFLFRGTNMSLFVAYFKLFRVVLE